MKNINDDALYEAAKKANINVDELRRAKQNGTMDDFINKKLSPDAASQLKKIMSDKSAMEKLLSTQQAKDLLNKLMNR